MPFHKFILIPIFISFQAFVLMLVGPYIKFEAIGLPGLATWIAFQAWAMYFLGGCTPKMAVKTVIGYFGGIIASVAIFELGDLLAGALGSGYWGYAIAVFIVVVPAICVQRVPWIDFVPAYFIGSGVFFGVMSLKPPEVGHVAGGYFSVALPEMIACIVGLCFGHVTVAFQTWYTAKVGGGEGEAGGE